VHSLAYCINDGSRIFGKIGCPVYLLCHDTAFQFPDIILAPPVCVISAVTAGIPFCPVTVPQVLNTEVCYVVPSAVFEAGEGGDIRLQAERKSTAVFWLFNNR
jgi:hypothetical protein